MDGGSTWADQWDSNPHSDPPPSKKSGGFGAAAWKKIGAGKDKTKAAASNSSKYVGEELGKSKAVATGGAKKVKEGTTAGFQWIKDKCQKGKQ